MRELVAVSLQACPSLSYLSVFDGHGGLEAAVYSASHLHCHLVHDPAFPEDVSTALRSAYTKTDQTFLQKAKQEVCGLASLSFY